MFSRYNLKFLQKDELNQTRESLYFRSKSMLELGTSKESCGVVRQSSAAAMMSCDPPSTDDTRDYLQDNVEALLEEYERSKRGFRTNPFLQDEREKMLVANRCMSSVDDSEKDTNKDSETRRKAWADMIGAALEFALTLPVSFCLNLILVPNLHKNVFKIHKLIKKDFRKISKINAH